VRRRLWRRLSGVAGFDGGGLSTGKPKYAAYEATLAKCETLGHELAAEFLRLADRDAEAYAATPLR